MQEPKFNFTFGVNKNIMKTLLSMTDFVLDNKHQIFSNTDKYIRIRIVKYATFLKQFLEKWMFVPCDEDGNALEEPEIYSQWVREKFNDGLENEQQINECKKYHQAKERVLFKTEFTIDDAKYLVSTFETIDNLAQLYKFELTPTALKQIGL